MVYCEISRYISTVMKKLIGLICFGVFVLSADAGDVQKRRAEETGRTYKEYATASGRVYQNVIITSINDAGISLTHADGTARLRFEHLTPEQREKFGITQEGATAVYAAEQKAKAEHEAKLAEQEKAHQEWLAKQVSAKSKADQLLADHPSGLIQQGKTVIESTLEIPNLPPIQSSDGSVLYGNTGQNSYRGPIRSHGGYVYPAGYYYPSRYYAPYPVPQQQCTPFYRKSIFHFTIK